MRLTVSANVFSTTVLNFRIDEFFELFRDEHAIN